MRRVSRIVLLAALTALMPALTACENLDLDNLDILGVSKKKPLPGDRKALFPEGVPGVTQGIPQEYQKGYVEQQQQLQQQQQATPTAEGQPAAGEADNKSATAAPTEEPKPAPKPKRTVSRKPKPAAPVQQSNTGQQQPAWPTQQQQQQQTQSPWPTQGQANTAPWPSGSPSGPSSQ